MGYQQEFIQQITPGAVEIQKTHGLPADALVAQVCLETGYGQRISKDYATGRNSKNLFNIKGTGPAGSVEILTSEYINGRWVKIRAKFRAYNTYAESFADYVKLILGAPRYAKAKAQRDPVGYAQELQRAGYATDPEYADKIVWIIKEFNITKLVEGLLMAEKPAVKPEVKQVPEPWALEAIADVKAAGLMVGDGEDFKPKDPVTREQLATILFRAKKTGYFKQLE